MIFLKNIDFITSILSQKRSGSIHLSIQDKSFSMYIFQGEYLVGVSKDLFFTNMMQIKDAHISFEEKTTERSLQMHPLFDWLWDFSEQSSSSSNEFCQEYLSTLPIGKKEMEPIYKLGKKIGVDTLLVYLFFSKSEGRTLEDLLSFYSYKSPQHLKDIVYRLFVVGQLQTLGTAEGSQKLLQQTKNLALQKVLNKLSALSKPKH